MNGINAVTSATPKTAAATATPGERRLEAAKHQLHRRVNELVGQTFYGTLFKAMRNTKLKGEYGHGGRGEEIFSAQLHELLALRMGQAQDLGINEALYRSLERYVKA